MTTIELGALRVGVDSAHDVLARPARTDLLRARVVSDALTLLDEVDGLLARLVFDPTLTPRLTAQIGRIRDDLGGHLLAAVVMQEIALPAVTVAGILRRGVAQAKRALDRLTEIQAPSR